MAKREGKQRSFLSTNIPLGYEIDPDENIPVYKRDYTPFSVRKTEPAPVPPPALVTHKDARFIREEQTETKASYPPHPLAHSDPIPRWTKLSSSVKMPTSSGEDAFVTTQRDYGPHRAVQLERPRRDRGRGFLWRSGRGQRLPGSTHQDPGPHTWSTHQESYTAPDRSRVDRRTALGPDPSIPTIKGDARSHSFETHHQATFDPKPLVKTAPVAKNLHVSVVYQGDKRRIKERQTTHSASFTRPEAHRYPPHDSSPVLKQRPLELRLGHTSSQSWTCTSRDAHRSLCSDPVVHVKRNKNLSSLPKGDRDGDRDRLSSTVTSTSYTKVKTLKPPEPEAGLRTKSNIHFGPSNQKSSYYSTTNSEHYGLKGEGGARPRPAPYTPSNILTGPDLGPSLTTAQEDFVSLPRSKAAPPSQSQLTTHVRFPVEAVLYSTTHRQTYTPKHTPAPSPAKNQLTSHILMV